MPKPGLNQAAGMLPGVDQFPTPPAQESVTSIQPVCFHGGNYPEKTILQPHKRLVRTSWRIRHKVNVDPIRFRCGVRIEIRDQPLLVCRRVEVQHEMGNEKVERKTAG